MGKKGVQKLFYQGIDARQTEIHTAQTELFSMQK
jgi:hypothetical protein